MCSGAEAGAYSRLIDSCITQLKAQGPSRTCNESKEEEEARMGPSGVRGRARLDMSEDSAHVGAIDLAFSQPGVGVALQYMRGRR